MPAINNGDTGLASRNKINAAIAAVEVIAKTNLTASTFPTATDDSSKGYSIGSTWLIPGTGEMWRARDVTVNSARWVKVDTADFDSFVSGRYYIPFSVNLQGANSPTTANVLRLAYGVIKQRVSIDQLTVRVTTGATNAMCQLAVYRSLNVAPTGLPIAKTASFSISSATSYATALDAGSVVLEPGPYWFGNCQDIQTTNLTYSAGPLGASLVGSTIVSETLGNGGVQGLVVNNTFGTMPDLTGVTLTTLSGNAVIPSVGFRVGTL